jgi:hypothetical protein
MGIKQVDDIISSAVGWYLYRDRYERKRFQSYLYIYGRRVIQRYPEMDSLPGWEDTSPGSRNAPLSPGELPVR